MKPKKPIESLILNLRGQKVILDADLAELYGVPTKRLNEQVKRNAERFPQDFLFQLTQMEADEIQCSRSQIATASRRNIRHRLNRLNHPSVVSVSTGKKNSLQLPSHV